MHRLIIASIVFVLIPTVVQAKSHHRYHYPFHHHHRHHGARSVHTGRTSSGRPHAWCGWYMRQVMGVADAAYNLARNWAHWGRATEAHVGAIVVWTHHVGKIVGGSPGRWKVISGNDGHRVRTRVRSVASAIAFRE